MGFSVHLDKDLLPAVDFDSRYYQIASFEIAADVKDYNAMGAHSNTEVLNHSGPYR